MPEITDIPITHMMAKQNTRDRPMELLMILTNLMSLMDDIPRKRDMNRGLMDGQHLMSESPRVVHVQTLTPVGDGQRRLMRQLLQLHHLASPKV